MNLNLGKRPSPTGLTGGAYRITLSTDQPAKHRAGPVTPPPPPPPVRS
ncbi:MAG: hypothetical protein LBS86_03120 [Treponema sp.]|nr:hypothetical protein [Treponema sp.]